MQQNTVSLGQQLFNMEVIETKNFIQDISSIDVELNNKINQVTWQNEPIFCEGRTFIKYKPILKNWKGEKPILKLGYLDNETLYIKDTIEINSLVYNTEYILKTLVFLSKKVNSLINTSVDVTFGYDINKKHTTTLQDWAFWRVLSDEKCLKKLKEVIIKKKRI